MNNLRSNRTKLLFGEDAFNQLQQMHILVFGVGGVGGYAAEQLVRMGIGEITIVDGDVVEESNCNRQIIALSSTIGMPKVEALKNRLLDINPELKINTIYKFIDIENIEILFNNKLDGVIDAIDSVPSKVAFIIECLKRKIPLVSSMGSGGKLRTDLISSSDISKTHGCALARVVRKKLRENGINKGVNVVFSSEEVSSDKVFKQAGQRPITGTASYIVAIFGCTCVAKLIDKLLLTS